MRRKTDRWDYLPPEEAEREIAALMESESDEATERYWERVMAAGRKLERQRGRLDWSREFVDDLEHAGIYEQASPTYSRPNGPPE